MRTAPKILVAILAVIAGGGLIRVFTGERFIEWLVLLVIACSIIDGIWDKQTVLGHTWIQRDRSPLVYWSVLLFYLALLTFTAYSLFFPNAREAFNSFFE